MTPQWATGVRAFATRQPILPWLLCVAGLFLDLVPCPTLVQGALATLTGAPHSCGIRGFHVVVLHANETVASKQGKCALEMAD